MNLIPLLSQAKLLDSGLFFTLSFRALLWTFELKVKVWAHDSMQPKTSSPCNEIQVYSLLLDVSSCRLNFLIAPAWLPFPQRCTSGVLCRLQAINWVTSLKHVPPSHDVLAIVINIKSIALLSVLLLVAPSTLYPSTDPVLPEDRQFGMFWVPFLLRTLSANMWEMASGLLPCGQA